MCGRVHCDRVTSFTLDTRKKAKPLAVLTALSVLVLLGSTLALQKRWGTLQTARMVQGMSATVVAVELAFIILGVKNAYCSKKPAKPQVTPEKVIEVDPLLLPSQDAELEVETDLTEGKKVVIIVKSDDGNQGNYSDKAKIVLNIESTESQNGLQFVNLKGQKGVDQLWFQREPNEVYKLPSNDPVVLKEDNEDVELP